jgi:hypothetical protein
MWLFPTRTAGTCDPKDDAGPHFAWYASTFTALAISLGESTMPEDVSGGLHLRTKFVFIDAQAFRKARCDWNGRSFSAFADLAKQGRLSLLVTDVTVREVKSQLQELLAEVTSSLLKHRGILGQLGAISAVDCVKNQAGALRTLETEFDEFLKRTKSIIVPLIADVKGVLDDYFARRPPFSNKKKAEFPDAITIASIRRWCEQNRSMAYVVSEDSDLRGCCSQAGPLLHAESVSQIISQATVSQQLHDALEVALRASDYLSKRSIDEIEGMDVDFRRSSSSGKATIVAAKIEKVHSVNVTMLNVLEQQEQTFTCEPEIEAEISFEINIEVEDRYGSDHTPPQYHSISVTKFEYFYPEVVVRFEPATGELEFESISFGTQGVRIDIDDVDARSYR